MKCKIFAANTREQLEEEINTWLAEQVISLEHVDFQAVPMPDSILYVVLLFYKELALIY